MGPFGIFLIILVVVIIGAEIARRCGFMAYEAQLLKEQREAQEQPSESEKSLDMIVILTALLFILYLITSTLYDECS